MSSRITSDPELNKFAKRISESQANEIRAMAVAVCQAALQYSGLKETVLMDASQQLMNDNAISEDLAISLRGIAETADVEYLDMLEEDGAECQRCLSLFTRARIFFAFSYLSRRSRVDDEEAIYEAIIGAHRHAAVMQILESAGP